MQRSRLIVLLLATAIVVLAAVCGVAYSAGALTNEARPHSKSEVQPSSAVTRSSITNELRAPAAVASGPSAPAPRNDP